MKRKELVKVIEENGAIELGHDDNDMFLYLTIDDESKLIIIYIDPKNSSLEKFDVTDEYFDLYELSELEI